VKTPEPMTRAVAGARRAAPSARRIRSQARFEALTLLRNGEQLLVSVILPALALVGLTLSPFPDLGSLPRVDIVTPGVLALAVASNAFTGQAIATAFDRRYGVLRSYGVSPLGRSGLIIGKTLAVLAVLGLQVIVLGGLGLALGWRPAVGGLLPGAVGLGLGAAAFVGLGLLLAGTLRAEAVLAVANLLWVLFLGLGLLLPLSTLPSWMEGIARWLPSGALGEALRGALTLGSWPWSPWAVLAAWAALTGGLALRSFRWKP